MKFIVLAACILGMAISAPLQIFEEFDIHYAPPQAAQVIPAGVPLDNLEVLLPVDAQRHPLGGPVHGFIKHEIPNPNGIGTKEVFYPFGFNLPNPAAADPAAPVAPAAPAAPAAPPAPVALADPAIPVEPLNPVVVAPPPRGKDDEDEDD